MEIIPLGTYPTPPVVRSVPLERPEEIERAEEEEAAAEAEEAERTAEEASRSGEQEAERTETAESSPEGQNVDEYA